MSAGKLAHCMTRRSPRCRPVEERGSEEGGGGERGSVKGSRGGVWRGGERECEGE